MKAASPTQRSVELIGAILVLLGLLRVASLFSSNGYLPAPFVFDVGDTLMDWFNTAFWANREGAYSVWRTIYLPLSFVITDLFSDPRCYDNHPYDARDCDVFGIVVIVITYLACVVVTAFAMYRHDKSTALFRTIAISVGGPLLYAFERGNLIMLAYIAFAMIYGGLINSRYGTALAYAFMANLKVYLVFPVAALAIKRDWRLLELCGLASLTLYLITLLLVGAGTPAEFISNLQNWFQVRLGSIWDEVLYTTTYKPFLQLDVYQYPVRDYLQQSYVDAAKIFIEYYVLLSRGVAILCIGLAWFYPKSITTTRLVFFILMQSFISQNPGGYSITLIVFLVFMERWRNAATAIALICAYLISVPGDLTVTKIFDVQREVWLSGRIVMSEYVLPWGALVRPGVIAIMLWALAIDTLITMHRAMKASPPNWKMLLRHDGTERADGDDAPNRKPPLPAQ